MADRCTYFSSTEWDDRRWVAGEGWSLDAILNSPLVGEIDAELERALVERLDVSDADALADYTVGDVWPTDDPPTGITRDDVLSAWDAREETPDPTAKCPHEPTDGDRCVFHDEDADPSAVRDAFLEAVSADSTEKRVLSGATLPDLDLAYERLAAPDAYPIRLNYADVAGLDLTNATVEQGVNLNFAEVSGDATFHNTAFRRHVGLRGASIDGGFVCDEASFDGYVECIGLEVTGPVSVTRATFGGAASFRGAVFENGMTVANSRFLDVTSFDDADLDAFDAERAHFEEVASFDKATAAEAAFPGSTFDDYVLFDGASIESLDLTEAEFGSRAFLQHVTVDEVSFAGATIDGRVTFAGATVSSMAHFGAATVEELHVVDADVGSLVLMDATVRDGRIEVPDDPEFLCNLTEARLGDVAFEGPRNRFESVLFADTEFDGFDFATDSHREALEAVGWNIHEAAADVADDEERTFETTYLRAKQGALDQGDASAASKFFVREMRQRRADHLAAFGDQDASYPSRLAGLWRAASNALLDVSTVYGERPHRVVSISLVVVLVSAVLYPLTDGLLRSSDGTVATYATEGVGALPDALYFSVVSFTTVGYGDLSPAGPVARALAGAEAFLGAFLLALLVFVFGRTMRL